MKVRYEESFLKDVRKLKDERVKQKVKRVINSIKSASDLTNVPNLKKIKGGKGAYRIRVGNYHLGFYLVDDVVEFAKFMDRKDIYKKFP